MDLKNEYAASQSRRTFMKNALLTTVVLSSVAFSPLSILNAEAQTTTAGGNSTEMPAYLKMLFDNTRLKPTKVFENLYCIGSKSVVTWVLKTSSGLILIDSMWDNTDAEFIIEGMKELGLNPTDIKYILLTHGHGDHYGGAQYIKEKYNAKIFLSKIDTEYMHTAVTPANGPRSPKCTVDIFLEDGVPVILGDTIITPVATHGHTPGCMSFIYPVMQDGKSLMAGQWGGTGLPRDINDIKDYRKSIDHFQNFTTQSDVTVLTFAHLFENNGEGYRKLADAQIRKVNENNPFQVGTDGVKKYLDDLRKKTEDAISGALLG